MTEQDLKECIAEVKHSAIPEQSKEKIINTLQNNRWIPCSERKPEPLKDVLVTDGENVWSDTYDDKAPYAYYFAGEADVIAWQPLPEPYKESDGE